jgi:hypothetical protein
VVRVHVGDEEVLVATLDRLLGGVLQERSGIERLGGEIAEAAGMLVHGIPLCPLIA